MNAALFSWGVITIAIIHLAFYAGSASIIIFSLISLIEDALNNRHKIIPREAKE